MQIRQVEQTDAPAVANIYNYYVTTSHVTFEVEPIDGPEMLARISEGLTGGYPFMVAEEELEIVGYAYAHKFRPRPAYRHSVETSIYIRPGHEGKKVGTRLYENLFEEIRLGDFRVVIAGISLPNDASVRLHQKLGFKQVAHFHEVGRKFGRWIDVAYLELILTQ